MNKFIAFVIFLTCYIDAASQSIYPYEEIKLDKPADYKTAEPFALNAATFLLSTPFKAKDNDRERALKFLIKLAPVPKTIILN
ncbi:MAG: hypothetical protein QM737_22410 [Ferruginibacter sp.]